MTTPERLNLRQRERYAKRVELKEFGACPECGKGLSRNAKRCRPCGGKARKGVKHKSKNPEKVRSLRAFDLKYLEWAKTVKVRDVFTCQKCSQVGGKLESHHMESWSVHVESRYALNCGVTLCKKCHKEFHSLYGLKFFTKDNCLEFLGSEVMKAIEEKSSKIKEAA